MRALPILFCLFVALPGWGQTRVFAPDTALVRKTKADAHGMRHFQFVLLTTGPNKDTARAPRNTAFAGHMANITHMAATGKLLLAGPFGGKSTWRGLFIFDVATQEEAEGLVKTDPAVQAGYLTYEVHPWFGSAAMMLIPELHKKLESASW